MPKPIFREEAISDIARQALFLHEVAHPDIAFTLDAPEPSPTLVCDRRQLGQALTNVVKYANASQARVSVTRSNGHAIVEIADDGCGGADPGRGSGLRGLADRISALDGTLELSSPEGAGTLLRAEIPV